MNQKNIIKCSYFNIITKYINKLENEVWFKNKHICLLYFPRFNYRSE